VFTVLNFKFQAVHRHAKSAERHLDVSIIASCTYMSNRPCSARQQVSLVVVCMKSHCCV
jgi:hypothetical protein